jgi:hypothetical protein
MEKEMLLIYVKSGYSTHKIAELTNKSQTTVRYWLKKYDIDVSCKVAICKFCGETDLDKFHNKGGGRKSLSKCKSCHNKYTIERFRQYKIKSVKYKGGKCCKCGYSGCVGSLHFHHLDPVKKDPDWKKMRTWKFDRIKKELDKCELVCANCHGEIHWNGVVV